MKFSTAFTFVTMAASASAFSPASTSMATRNTGLAMSSKPEEFTSMDWVGYYTGLGPEKDADMATKIPKDFGFDPLGFSDNNSGMFFQREAEIKHCRLAMLAAAGW